MNRRIIVACLVVFLATTLLFLTPTGQAVSQEIRQVIVTNWPPVQEITGEVDIRNPVRLARLESFEDVIVPPVEPTETTRLVEGGTLQTDGFPRVVLSVHGVVKGETSRSGSVGAILVPDQSTIRQAFDELGIIHFELRASAEGVSARTPYFASNQPDYTVGFQAYKIYFYNTTDKTVTVNLFAYLTN